MGPYSDRYTYDQHGNMLTMPHLPVLTWDERDRLRSTTRQRVNAGTPETTYYTYDADGQRVRKVTENQAAANVQPKRKSERIYLGPFELYRRYEADGVTVAIERETLQAMDGKQRVVLVESRTRGQDPAPAQLIRFQYTNHLGSALLELDDKADVVTYEEYFPYGSSSFQSVRNQQETPKRYRYTSKERDEESDLYYHGARYCASWLGRWTSCDPLGTVDGLNVYQYSRSNPIQYSDPTGHQSKDENSPEKDASGNTDHHADESGGGEASSDSGGDAPQMFLPLLGITNGSWMGQYPLYTLRTEFATLLPFQSATDPKVGTTFGPAQYLSVSDRLGKNFELSVIGTVNGTIPIAPPPTPPGTDPPTAKGGGSLGFGLHFGPEAPKGDDLASGAGLWITLSQVWGQEPDRSSPPPGWSANPSLNAFATYSWQKPNRWGYDLNGGATISRWGQVNGVSVGGLLSPFLGLNYSRNLTENDVLNWEATVALNLGLAGRFDGVAATSMPLSATVNLGLFGYQHIWGDWGIGVEPWLFFETGSNVANAGAPLGNWGGGLRFGFGAINPRREHVDVMEFRALQELDKP